MPFLPKYFLPALVVGLMLLAGTTCVAADRVRGTRPSSNPCSDSNKTTGSLTVAPFARWWYASKEGSKKLDNDVFSLGSRVLLLTNDLPLELFGPSVAVILSIVGARDNDVETAKTAARLQQFQFSQDCMDDVGALASLREEIRDPGIRTDAARSVILTLLIGGLRDQLYVTGRDDALEREADAAFVNAVAVHASLRGMDRAEHALSLGTSYAELLYDRFLARGDRRDLVQARDVLTRVLDGAIPVGDVDAGPEFRTRFMGLRANALHSLLAILSDHMGDPSESGAITAEISRRLTDAQKVLSIIDQRAGGYGFVSLELSLRNYWARMTKDASAAARQVKQGYIFWRGLRQIARVSKLDAAFGKNPLPELLRQALETSAHFEAGERAMNSVLQDWLTNKVDLMWARLPLEYLRSILTHDLNINVAEVRTARQEAHDAAMPRRFQELMARAGELSASDRLVFETHLYDLMATYYRSTARMGLSLPYAMKKASPSTEAAYREASDAASNKIAPSAPAVAKPSTDESKLVQKRLEGFAIALADRGELELALTVTKKAIDGNIHNSRNPPSSGDAYRHVNLVLGALEIAGQSGNVAEVKSLWSDYLADSPRFPFGKPLQSRNSMLLAYSKALDLAGDREGAFAAFTAAKVQMEANLEALKAKHNKISKETIGQIENPFACVDSERFIEMGNPDAAEQSLTKCLSQRTSGRVKALGFRGWSTIDTTPWDLVDEHRLWGFLEETRGRLDRARISYSTAIGYVEQLRGSFNVAERLGFFRNAKARAPYQGLIRVSARLALDSKGSTEQFDVLAAQERLRARQLADTLGAEPISGIAIERFARTLPTDTVVLSYTMMPGAIVGIGFDQTRRVIHISAAGVQQLNSDIRTAAAALANPDSSITSIEQRLRAISTSILRPMDSLLAGKTEIIVLADNALSLLPFGLLSTDSDGYRPLALDRNVRSMPSLRLAIDRPKSDSAAGGFFAAADPIYPEYIPAADVVKIAAPDLEKESQVKRGKLAPLPETRREVRAIAALNPASQSRLLLGSDALESNVKSADLSQYRFVHFATHGLLGGDLPGVVEPSLAFGSEPGEDGLLRMSEAEKLKLRAELTVLSACNTGTGALVTGEGVMGMSRAFLLAGSRGVLVSLWSVASDETEALMVHFYKSLHAGKSQPAALRAAMLAIREKRPHPFFWAPFIIVSR